AKWWDEKAFERVICAIEDAAEPAAEVVDQESVSLPDRYQHKPTMKLSAKVDSIVETTRPAATPGKRKLEDMLRQAVQNTARMTPPPEKQP
nr:hypothetical protein [Pyrinomonadaceae bacterium]